MTPHLSDIYPGSLKLHRGGVTVANSGTSRVTHKGEVHLTLFEYRYGKAHHQVIVLHDVLVVPDLASQLLSTDALNLYGHGVYFNPPYINQALRNCERQERVSYCQGSKTI